ncbi:hypothetical protein D3C84_802530 [compost metagenome]
MIDPKLPFNTKEKGQSSRCEPIDSFWPKRKYVTDSLLAGSLIGGVQANQELLDFCANLRHSSDLEYRFLIYITSMRDVAPY